MATINRQLLGVAVKSLIPYIGGHRVAELVVNLAGHATTPRGTATVARIPDGEAEDLMNLISEVMLQNPLDQDVPTSQHAPALETLAQINEELY
jgi:hypothetical protein